MVVRGSATELTLLFVVDTSQEAALL